MRSLLRVGVIFSLVFVILAPAVSAGVPKFLSYQGRLKDGSGTPYEGTKLVKFTIYDGAGTPLWNSGFVLITFAGGLFTTTLGDGSQPALPGGVFAADTGLTIGVTVDTDPEIAPRTRLVAVPYAFAAQNADTAQVVPDYLPLAGGTMAGPITSAGDPSITMGKGNFGSGCQNDGIWAFVAGSDNTANGNYATVSGGRFNHADSLNGGVVSGGGYNVASGNWSVVGGGIQNVASGAFSVVAGGGSDGAVGIRNQAGGTCSAVGGGNRNKALADYSAIGGGYQNEASGQNAVVGGGEQNRARGDFSVVSGGGGGGAADSNVAAASWSAIGGGRGNSVQGSYSAILGGYQSSATGAYAVVGGGAHNYARGDYSVVAGGGWNAADSNSATGRHSTISGGAGGRAVGWYSMIPGGFNNTAFGFGTLAAGVRAKASHDGCFVWGDDTNADITSTGINQFIARATGGVKFFSNSALTTGVQLTSGGGSWGSISDRNLKEHFDPVDPRAVLEAVASIPITTWNYKSQDAAIRHIGPMAQDFYAAFNVGEDDRHITTVDADGVALAAIQGLKQALDEKEREIQALRDETSELRSLVESLLGEQARQSANGDTHASVEQRTGRPPQ